MNLEPTADDRYQQQFEHPLKPGDAFVAICDWNGVVRWLSNHTIKTKVGDLGWSNMVPEDAERFKEAFARVATLHERNTLEIASINGLRYKIWLWSIGTPDLAVCTFNLMVPPEIASLTGRERELMEQLALGHSMKQIANDLDVSVNTLHAHMRNIKSKLEIDSSSEAISFAARFFHHSAGGSDINPAQETESRRSSNEAGAPKRKSGKQA